MIEQLLKSKNMSIYECSKKSGIPYSTLSDLVHQKNDLKRCSSETLYKLAKVLNVSMESLLEGRI